ncbi:MAG: hypothetical protein F2813_00215 [Actinobacteria bacterium]|uniref:Unannotated protein n=1 Tax=freshwater metagenome TaxID=449393 RepID=A0A6J5YUY4_9ZZZZ|nr:hypothetical protein [Actinomycetota bacterium]
MIYRALAALPITAAAALLAAPAALATQEPISGEGTYGVADDRVVTMTGFIVIAFFPLFILCMSLLQWRLEKRKDARKVASKRLEAAAGDSWRSGW